MRETLMERLEQSRPKLAKIETTGNNLLKVMPANGWLMQAKARPVPRQLFHELWHEGELCILFSDSNLGKSILAVQIGDQISRGDYDGPRHKVLYCDFELSDKQFEGRYSDNFNNHYQFDENFLRAEISIDDLTDDNFEAEEDAICNSMEKSIKETGAKILIVDNITYLRNETEKAKNATPLMKRLKGLKAKYGLSILALAHTPKRDTSRPLTKNDLQGSRMIYNYCDTCFAIGESTKDKSIRYLKQLKARYTEMKYDAGNVMVFEITKNTNVLRFSEAGFSSEQEHLRLVSDEESTAMDQQIIELAKTAVSHREIARQLGTNPMKVGRVLKRSVTPVTGVTGVTGVTPVTVGDDKPPF
jgi:RecA-family ATPase